MGRGPTAYFLFSDENRASAKAELEAQPGDGKKGVAQVAKLIGQRWAALSDEEKQQYKERAAKLQEEAAAAAAAEQGPDGEGEGAGDDAAQEGGVAAAAGGSSAAAPPLGLPTSLVKRLIMLDGDVSRVSADAVRAISKAAELFMGQLAVRAMEHAVAGKRKNFKMADVEHVAGRDRRMLDMGLREILEEQVQAAVAAAAEAAGEEPGSTAKPAAKGKKQKRDEAAAAGTRQITAFFGAAQAEQN